MLYHKRIFYKKFAIFIKNLQSFIKFVKLQNNDLSK
jgi:hypothetical protein